MQIENLPIPSASQGVAAIQGLTSNLMNNPNIPNMPKLPAISSPLKIPSMPKGMNVEFKGLSKLTASASKAKSLIPIHLRLIIGLAVLIGSLLFLIAVFVVVYLIYKMFTTKYPRTFGLGHSEPYEEFVKQYLADLLTTMNLCKDNKDKFVNAETQKLCQTFLEMRSSKDKSLMLFGKLKPSPMINPDDCTPQNLPCLYMYLIFKEAIEGKEGDSELVLYPNFFEDVSYATGIESSNKQKRKETIAAVLPDIKQIHEFFQSLTQPSPQRKTYIQTKNTYSESQDVFSLKLTVLASYRNDILKAYDFRKSGGPGNMKLFLLLMRDYINYVFKEIIPNLWKTIKDDIVSTGGRFFNFVKSLAPAVEKLPLKLAGIEKFVEENHDLKQKYGKEHFAIFQPPFSKPGDTVEHLGFLKGLLFIPKFFMMLVGVVKALIRAITDPKRFFMLILGLIIGLIIGILYQILLVISPIFYAAAAIWVTAIKLYTTTWWLLLFAIIAIFYLLVWLLDYLTRGHVLPLFRCENLPNLWYKGPGMAFGNRCRRGFFCNYPCYSKYTPDGMLWCSRLPKHMPAYCPQQYIYRGFELLQNSLNSPTNVTEEQLHSNTPLLVEYKPDASFYTMSEEEQRKVIADVIKDKYKFMTKCYSQYNDFKGINMIKKGDTFHGRGEHLPKNNDIYNRVSRSVCDYIHDLHIKAKTDLKLKAKLQENKILVTQLQELCKATYCKQSYVYDTKKKQWTLSEKRPAYGFCDKNKQDNFIIDTLSETNVNEDKRDMLGRVIMLVMLTIVIGLVFAIILYYSKDSDTDILNYLKSLYAVKLFDSASLRAPIA